MLVKWWRKSVWMHVAEYNTSTQGYLQPIRRMKSCLRSMTMTSQLRPCLFFSPACQQAPNIDIQCLGPDWQRPAWRDPAGMHTSHETALWEAGAWGGSTSPWRLSTEFQCGSIEPSTLMWFWLIHTQFAASVTMRYTVCLRIDMVTWCWQLLYLLCKPPWMSLITAWVTFNLLRWSCLFCRWYFMLICAYKMVKTLKAWQCFFMFYLV